MSYRPKVKQSDGSLVDLPIDAETVKGQELGDLAFKDTINNEDVANGAAIAQGKIDGLQTDYVASLSVSGKTVTYKNKNGTSLGTITTQDTTYGSATRYAAGLMSATDKTKLDNIDPGANKYTLPVASLSALGGVKVGYEAIGKNYPLLLDTNGKAYVNVPWTDNNTTYTAGTGISIGSDNKISLSTPVSVANGGTGATSLADVTVGNASKLNNKNASDYQLVAEQPIPWATQEWQKGLNLLNLALPTNTLGLSITRSPDGSIAISGTSTNRGYLYFNLLQQIPVGIYTFTGGSGGLDIELCDSSNTIQIDAQYTTSPVTKNTTANLAYMRIWITYNGSYDYTLYPMLVEGPTAYPYQPYYGEIVRTGDKYPLGTYIYTDSSTPPSVGSWEQIGGVFLLGANSSYPAGSTGGSLAHYHDIAIQSRTLNYSIAGWPGNLLRVKNYQTGEFVTDGIVSTSPYERVPSVLSSSGYTDVNVGVLQATGTTSSASTLPPYKAVYIWHRIA